MSFMRNFRPQWGTNDDEYWSSLSRNNFGNNTNNSRSRSRNNGCTRSLNNPHDFSGRHNRDVLNYSNYVKPDHSEGPSWKRRKFSDSTWGDSSGGRPYLPPNAYDCDPSTCFDSGPPARFNSDATTSTSCKRDRSKLDDDEELIFMSRDDIERHSPSRKDGIDAMRETHLRYSYCAFIQNLGLRLELPQTTTATAMVLCHRFFVRRSHACHDRFLIATAAVFLAAKSEETARPLNNVLRASCELFHKQDMTFLSYLLPVDWFEQYRERVIEAENMILTTLNFELNVHHPYAPLTSVLNKLGLSQTMLVTLALNLISEGCYMFGYFFESFSVFYQVVIYKCSVRNRILTVDARVSREMQILDLWRRLSPW
ncbi:cyclin-T1-4-like isoform X2 [Humulus lupulus]|uniref:cyclin-T1-4-like isoform X2 n=1 Tax=Humulus lupulus TaxID=3486 RepID=UPI002B40EFA9|nr:cyclin-T1-4-like isoform X2 [Humulus lupulus]XP_062108392.1 cyclin-T1-4-like isoform X2 [Humulus lupulus]XP_062108393.1 cyclin-T1-4-like isoform X2 [Humulus lupulus]